MGSKKRGSKIKRDRIMLILKSRKLTITKLAEEIGYNRRALNYAISHEYMDDKTLDDIARHLNVSPEFLTGVYPLRKLKDEYKNGFEFDGEKYTFSDPDPSGYDIPRYETDKAFKEFRNTIKGYLDPYSDFLTQLGIIGLKSNPFDKNPLYFDSAFVHSNSGYLFPPIQAAVYKAVRSALDQDPDFVQWKDQQGAAALESEEIPDLYEVIEEGQPDEE